MWGAAPKVLVYFLTWAPYFKDLKNEKVTCSVLFFIKLLEETPGTLKIYDKVFIVYF